MRCNPQIWFGERELKHIPPHFVRCNTPSSQESLVWVRTVLEGRFALSSAIESNTILLKNPYLSHTIYFEDPAEAMMYELRWS